MQPENYITTFSKRRFSPLSPKTEDIDITDIAHALSYLCRANGHFDRFYSVAQHSLNCAREAVSRGFDSKTALLLLLHDASEAYISDITRPVKLGLPEYRLIEERLQKTIYKSFKLIPDEKMSECEKMIDNVMLYAEFSEMASEKINAVKEKLCSTPDFKERSFKEVEIEFLNLFGKLYQELGKHDKL